MAAEGFCNNDYITFFSILTFAKALCDNVLQPSLLRSWGCNTLSHSGLANVNTGKRMFYPLDINKAQVGIVISWSVPVCYREFYKW